MGKHTTSLMQTEAAELSAGMVFLPTDSPAWDEAAERYRKEHRGIPPRRQWHAVRRKKGWWFPISWELSVDLATEPE